MLASVDLAGKLQQHKATIAQNSSKLLSQITEQFAPEAKILYVPTGAGGSSVSEIEAFLKNFAKQSYIIEDEQVISSTVSDRVVYEESILKFTHSDHLDWLLPGVKPTRKVVAIPLVSRTEFNANGKIVSKRVYWDQASVLRQIGVLPRSLYCKSNASEVVLPLLDSSITNGLEGLSVDNIQLLKLSIEPGHDDIESPILPKIVKPVAPKYETAIPQGDEPKPSPRRAPRVEQDGLAASGMPTRASPSIARVFSEELEAPRPSSRVLAPPGGISNIFNDEPEKLRPSSRVLAQPGGKTSDIFSNEPLPQKHVAVDPRRYQTSFSLTNDETLPQPKNRRDPNQSVQQLNGHTGKKHYERTESRLSSADANEDPAGKRTVSNAFAESSPVETAAPVRTRRDPNAQSSETSVRSSTRYMH